MIAIWAGLIAGCLAAIPCPCQICERGRLPQTHVFIKVTVSRMGWARRRSRLRGSSCTIVRILIRAICAISFSVAFPVVVDAQVICFAVKLVAGTRCSACWNWRVASLKRWHLFKSLVQNYKFFTPLPPSGNFWTHFSISWSTIHFACFWLLVHLLRDHCIYEIKTQSALYILVPNYNCSFFFLFVSSVFLMAIGHFRVPLCLCFKASLSAKPFLWKWLWFAWEWNCMQNSFSYERFRTYTRFETETQENSEMAYCIIDCNAN